MFRIASPPGFAAAILTAVLGMLAGPAQSGDQWTNLLDGTSAGEWHRAGDSNWRSEDGALVADRRAGKDFSYLVSKSAYKDFVLRVEFWASDDANSGVFLRCSDAANITDRTCYEANIFDQRKDPATAPARSPISPRWIRCRRPAANGTPTRSPPRGVRSPWC